MWRALLLATLMATTAATILILTTPPLAPPHCSDLTPLATWPSCNPRPTLTVTYGTHPPHPNAAAVAHALTSSLARGEEASAHVAIFQHGKLVLDIRGRSHHAHHTNEGVPDDDLFVVFSSTKVVEALGLAVALEKTDHPIAQSQMFNTKIADVWPEFASVSPSATLATLMRHQLGLPALPSGPIVLDDPSLGGSGGGLPALEAMLASLTPETNGTFYHALTRGLFVEVLAQKLDPASRSLARIIQEDIVVPLGLESCFCLGAQCTPEMDARVVSHLGPRDLATAAAFLPQILLPRSLSSLLFPPNSRHALDPYESDFLSHMVLGGKSTLAARSIAVQERGSDPSSILSSAPAMANSKAFRARGLSSAAGVASASCLAKMGAVLAAGGSPILSPSTMAAASEVDANAPLYDAGFFRNVSYTAAGWASDRFAPFGFPGWSGWAGAGGSVFVWHAESNTSFAYTPSLLLPRLKKNRGLSLLNIFLK